MYLALIDNAIYEISGECWHNYKYLLTNERLDVTVVSSMELYDLLAMPIEAIKRIRIDPNFQQVNLLCSDIDAY